MREPGTQALADVLKSKYRVPVWVCIKLKFTCTPRWPFIIPPLPPSPAASDAEWDAFLERAKEPPIGLPPPPWGVPPWEMSARMEPRSHGQARPSSEGESEDFSYHRPKLAGANTPAPTFEFSHANRKAGVCGSDCTSPGSPLTETPVALDVSDSVDWTGAFDEYEVDGLDFWASAAVYDALRRRGDL